MKSSIPLLLLPSLASAFPGLEHGQQPAPKLHEERELVSDVGGLLGDVVGGLVETVEGLLGSVAAAVDLDNLRPEPGYEFQEPGPNDSRGPCPGLNLLANYGYLPRDGFVTAGQVLEAVSRGFNMAADLATVLVVFAILTDGDVATETFYLGTGTNHVGGLNRHSTIEVDISPNREDMFNGCGDNHHLSSRLFEQNVKFAAADPTRQFTFDVMARQYSANSRFSQQYNPYLYYFPFPSIVSVVAFNFYSAFFSNGTYGLGGVANYESISSIIGAELDKETGHFKYVPERWPENWYRRALPYEAVEALADGFLAIYPSNPVGMPIGQLGTPNFNVTNILCDVQLGITSVTPLFLGGDVVAAEAAASWALGKFADAGLDATALGCPAAVVSPNELFPNRTLGGNTGVEEPPSVFRWTGNNVYNKTYFCETPDPVSCDHTC